MLTFFGKTRIESSMIGFFAGTMFWFRIDALNCLMNFDNELIRFENEDGSMDGTLAHAFERIFSVLVEQNGFKVVGSLNLTNEISTENVSNYVPVSD